MRVASMGKVVGVLALVTIPPLAGADDKQNTDFQKAKQHQIQMLETRLNCLKSANTRQELRICHEKAKQERKHRQEKPAGKE
ncbi:MAG: hypothetical protein HQL78_06890 [Magnetococcales bacterium]|nr:hypothetical protein [Magnetococcales bacterium]